MFEILSGRKRNVLKAYYEYEWISETLHCVKVYTWYVIHFIWIVQGTKSVGPESTFVVVGGGSKREVRLTV